ncbi:MAG: hypothetical protein U0903_00265 [Planctomycetales bacterium]
MHETALPVETNNATPWGPWKCRLIGGLLGLHLLAVVVGPWAVAPSSILSQDFFGVLGPYLEATYLNHGYHFFAPEPGPSHLIRYEITRGDGSTLTGVFPDKNKNWPRLMYHRHFMLTEHLNSFAEGDDKEAVETHSQSYARHLLKQHAGVEAKLILIRHELPSPNDVLSGKKLTDRSLYTERSLGTYKATTL